MDIGLTPFLQAALLVAAAGLAAATAAGFFGAVSGWFDYAAHFRPHLALGALLVAAGVWWLFDGPGNAWLASAIGLVAVVNVATVLAEHRYRAPATVADDAATLKVAAFNLLFLNRQYDRGRDWVLREQPDVLVFTEVTDRWAATIDALGDLYPYRAVRLTGFVTMVARRPWTSLEVVAGPRPRQGLLVARFDVAGTPLTIIGAHPASPIRPHTVRARDRELDLVARLAREAPGPVAAMGDFNATPWSAPMRRLVRTSPLRYADLRASTWPTSLPRWLGIKIDHIMLGKGCAVVEYKTGPELGSDHRPVVATIRCTLGSPLP
ncbi:MAG: endonuclease/exonuclease/phosphatase family protein [Alphaproteobacteria bacterium]|nr:endonuclease/exonuclease/phosphatase family protein [Alphaproteobacteria bacterium]